MYSQIKKWYGDIIIMLEHTRPEELSIDSLQFNPIIPSETHSYEFRES